MCNMRPFEKQLPIYTKMYFQFCNDDDYYVAYTTAARRGRALINIVIINFKQLVIL